MAFESVSFKEFLPVCQDMAPQHGHTAALPVTGRAVQLPGLLAKSPLWAGSWAQGACKGIAFGYHILGMRVLLQVRGTWQLMQRWIPTSQPHFALLKEAAGQQAGATSLFSGMYVSTVTY